MKTDPNPSEDAVAETEDVYAAQRDELMRLLRDCMECNEPLRVHGKVVLSNDDIPTLLQKIKNRLPFSRREREGLVEAGFAVARLFPRLI